MLENNEFSDEEMDYVLIEFRNYIADAKTFYLVCIHIVTWFLSFMLQISNHS